MSIKEALIEDITTIRDEIRNLFVVMMALLTGSFTIFFQVLNDELDSYFSFLGIIGILLLLVVLLIMKRKRKKLDELIKHLKELK
jgi:LPXTG-motif cell wall-anchored protein